MKHELLTGKYHEVELSVFLKLIDAPVEQLELLKANDRPTILHLLATQEVGYVETKHVQHLAAFKEL